MDKIGKMKSFFKKLFIFLKKLKDFFEKLMESFCFG